ncbi:MAG TPA: SDR family oxidoreductase [Candidatus Binataceae bacterium]|jgi:NAD(P)-dependent dehydrogenase (short-subunit alcohol dehydrogenase family)
MSDNRTLAGKTAFITGGSGAIGRYSAKWILRDGASVLLMARRADALEKTRAELQTEVPGGRVEICAGDARNADDVRSALAKAYAIANRLDIVVPTVGGSVGYRPLLMCTEDHFRKDLEINLVTTFIAVRYGVPMMTRGGAIVCISSTAAKMPFNGLVGYGTAKGGLENFVQAVAEELGVAGIRINAVRPGLMRATNNDRLMQEPVHGKFVEQMPLGRTGEPDDIAAAVRYLAGPESSWMTGQSFAVDGGHELRRNPDLTFMMEQMYGKEALDAVHKGKTP